MGRPGAGFVGRSACSFKSTARASNNYDIYVINADGSGITRLIDHPASDTFPEWSTDGRKLAFTSDRDGNDNIYIMNADGSGVVRLTRNSANDEKPSWTTP